MKSPPFTSSVLHTRLLRQTARTAPARRSGKYRFRWRKMPPSSPHLSSTARPIGSNRVYPNPSRYHPPPPPPPQFRTPQHHHTPAAPCSCKPATSRWPAGRPCTTASPRRRPLRHRQRQRRGARPLSSSWCRSLLRLYGGG